MAAAKTAPPADPWRTQAEAAEQLQVTDRTIRSYIAKGDLPATKIKGSGRVRIRQSAIDAMLQPIPTVERAS
jgi:excisionase family DNA binding protein